MADFLEVYRFIFASETGKHATGCEQSGCTSAAEGCGSPVDSRTINSTGRTICSECLFFSMHLNNNSTARRPKSAWAGEWWSRIFQHADEGQVRVTDDGQVFRHAKAAMAAGFQQAQGQASLKQITASGRD